MTVYNVEDDVARMTHQSLPVAAAKAAAAAVVVEAEEEDDEDEDGADEDSDDEDDGASDAPPAAFAFADAANSSPNFSLPRAIASRGSVLSVPASTPRFHTYGLLFPCPSFPAPAAPAPLALSPRNRGWPRLFATSKDAILLLGLRASELHCSLG